jgi:hypothetical protein
MSPISQQKHTEPAKVHNPLRPSRLAGRRHKSPDALLALAGSWDASAGTHGFPSVVMEHELQSLFDNDTPIEPSPPIPAYSPTAKSSVDTTSGSSLTSPQFEDRLKQTAPSLLSQWQQVNNEKNELIRELYKELTTAKKKKDEEWTRIKLKPWESSRELPKGMRDRPPAPLPSAPKSDDDDVLRERGGHRSTGSWGLPHADYDHNDSPGSNQPTKAHGSAASGESFAFDQRARSQSAGSSGSDARSLRELKMEGDMIAFSIKVKAKLTPAIVLLSKRTEPDRADKSSGLITDFVYSETLKRATKAARSAYYTARERNETPEGKALMGLCEFYIGLCRLASATVEHSVSRIHDAERWFAQASLNAQGFYPEANWASDCLHVIHEVLKKMGNVRSPSSEGESWSGETMNSPAQKTVEQVSKDWAAWFKNQCPNLVGAKAEDEVAAEENDNAERVPLKDEPDQLPTFQESQWDTYPTRPRGGLRIANPDFLPSSPSSFASSKSALHSPSSSISSPRHTKRRSVAFTALQNLSDTISSAVSSPKLSPHLQLDGSTRSIDTATIMARRMGRRLSSIATGVQKPDKYVQAEEGQSPYKATFGSIEEGDSIRPRKKSAEEMV